MKRLIKKFFNSVGLQVARIPRKQSKRTNRLATYKTATGTYCLPADAKGDVIAAAIIADKVFDKEIVDLAKKYAKPGTTVLDVGSNFGQMSVLMADVVGDGGKVHAFEADDFIFGILQKNVELNHKAKTIVTHFCAVHDKSGERLFFPVQDFERFQTYGSYGIDYVGKRGREVRTLAIDDVEFESPVSFMKIDIQGGDLFALRGAVRTIAKYRMPIIFEYEYLFEDELGLSFQEYVDFVRSIDYKFAKVIGGQNYLILPA